MRFENPWTTEKFPANIEEVKFGTLVINYLYVLLVQITWCLWWVFELIHGPEASVTSGEIWLILLVANLLHGQSFL